MSIKPNSPHLSLPPINPPAHPLPRRRPPSDATDTPPVIQINGDNPAIIQVGASYTDLGATITGPQADLNLGIQTYLNGTLESPIELDTSAAATDTIAYVVTDSQGLTSTSTRTIIIEPAAASPRRPHRSTRAPRRPRQFSKGERTRRCYDAKKSRRCG